VEEDSYGGGCANGGRGIEGGAECQSISDVVGEVGNEVEVAAELGTRVDLLFDHGRRGRVLSICSRLARAQ